jgi:alkyl sulfatase BDS1-like metallo-beta-lactamase superfamily hydrolase
MSARSIDPQQAVAAVRRTLLRAPNQLADSVGRMVRNAPDERLAQVMRGPARRAVLEGIFWQMPQYIDRTRARGVNSSVRWCITGRTDGGIDIYHLEIEEGSCRVIRGSSARDARLTITLDAAEFLRLATGGSDPMSAYFTGRVALTGDVMMAAKLASLLRIPVPSRAKPDSGNMRQD